MTDYVKRTGRVYVPCHAPPCLQHTAPTCCVQHAARRKSSAAPRRAGVRHVACHADTPRVPRGWPDGQVGVDVRAVAQAAAVLHVGHVRPAPVRRHRQRTTECDG